MINRFFIILFLMLIYSLIWIVPAYGKFIELSNDYVKVSVDYDSARFYLEISSNDFNNKFENNKALLFKKTPPTSFTTIAIDNQYYIYGSDAGNFKKKPLLDSKKIQSEWIIKDVSIIQEVSLINGQSTGNEDTMLIVYKITNKKNKKSMIGLRMLLDTVAGDLSARAFGIPGQGKIDKETRIVRDDIPPYWYYLDNYDNPVFGAMDTTMGDGITKPDRIIFAGWVRLTDNPWELVVDSTRDFRRPGTSQYNSAAAMYYDPVEIDKDKNIGITNIFGKYSPSYFTDKDMLMSLNVPKEPPSPPIPVAVELVNQAKTVMDKLEFEIIIPNGFKLSDNETNIIDFFKVETNASKKVLWNLINGNIGGKFQVTVKASGWINNNVQTIEAVKDFTINYFTGAPLQTTNLVSGPLSNTNFVLTNTNVIATNIIFTLPAVVSEQEKRLIKEIGQLDDLINDVNKKYQILMGIYKNLYMTNEIFLNEIDTNIQNFNDKLHDFEFNMSNENMLIK